MNYLYNGLASRQMDCGAEEMTLYLLNLLAF